ncbi:MAG: hypothetical protein M1823_002703 [Watsoniomyces obsoletus]|nr:MAG: hypothetical protein M1823_002703 [Watsoniomyces obsoletus]
MPADQLLATLLRALQHSYAPEESSKLLTTAASLLLSLSNPLNVTLLTSQLLSAPAIWERHDGLKTCLQVLRCFHTASSALAQPGQLEGLVIGRRLSTEDWIKAIIRGADKKSPRWKHLLPFAGLLLGLQNGPTLGSTVRGDLLDALVKAINLALEEAQEDDELPQQCITLAVNYTFDLLPESRFKEINREALLPVLVRSAFFSVEGLRSGYFLGPIDADVVQAGRNQFTWARESTTYFRLEQMLSRPLVTSMGPLSRLIGFSLEHVKNPALVYKSVEDVVLFARTLATQWRQNKLSEIDASEERIFIESDALATTIPRLWDVLKTCMFSCISVLRVVIARAVVDSAMARDDCES